MKIGTIITTFFLCTGTFFSCTHESIMNPEEEDGVANLSVVFAVEEMKTKTDTPATDDEAKLNEFIVALYDAADNQFIDSKTVNNPNSNGTTTDQVSKQTVPTYSVNFENIRIGKKGKSVYAIVIANSGLNFKTGNDIPVNAIATTSAFTPSTLIKAGKSKAVALSTPSTPESMPTTITVPMTQLSARIDFMGVTVENSQETFTPTRVTLSGGNAKTLVSIYSNNEVENTVYQNLNDITKSWTEAGPASFYTYEYTDGLSLNMTITGKFSGTSSQEKTFTLDIAQLLASNRLTLTKGHLYKITGTCPFTVNPTIHWAVVDAENIQVDIPTFN